MNNPYAPPEHPIPAPPEPPPPARPVSVLGVAIGGVVDIVLSSIVTTPLIVVVALSAGMRTLPPAQRGPAVVEALHQRPELFVTSIVLGALCSVFAGYLAARIARRAEVLNGALTSWMGIGIGLWSLATGSGDVGRHVLSIVVGPFLGAAGGYLRLVQRRRRTAAQP